MRRSLMLLTLPALLAGCFSFERVVKIKPDGSGTVTDSLIVNVKAIEASMKEMGKASEPGKKPEAPSKAEIAEAASKAKAGAGSLGPGVTFVSLEPVETADGWGTKTVYAFKDVSKLNLETSPNMGGGDGPPPAEGKPEGKADKTVKFKFEKKGKGGVLSAILWDSLEAMEKDLATKDGAKGDAKASPEMEAMGKQMLDQMKGMLAGMRMGMAIEVDGKLVKSSSPHVEGNRVWLFDVQFDKLLANEELLKKMDSSGQPSTKQMMELFQKVPGVKVNLAPQITIEIEPS